MFKDLTALNVLKDIRDGEYRELSSLVGEYCRSEIKSAVLAYQLFDNAKIDLLFTILKRLESLNIIRRDNGSEKVLNSSLVWARCDFDGIKYDPPLVTWRATEALWELQHLLKISLSDLQNRQNRPHSELRQELIALLKRLEQELPATVFKEDLLYSIKELSISLRETCYISTLSLCGKILEIGLKAMMDYKGLDFQDDWMLGTLLRKLSSEGEDYLDPSLKNIANIINQHRIPAVHSKRDIPIPSEHQASMVVNATIDVIKRVFLNSALKKTNPGFKISVSEPLSD